MSPFKVTRAKILFYRFLNHMERTVEANLTKAKRGGIPGVLSLIEAYLNVVHTSRYSFEVSFQKICQS